MDYNKVKQRIVAYFIAQQLRNIKRNEDVYNG